MQRLFYGGTNMYLGVDLGSTNIKAAIYDGSMQLVGQQSRPGEYLPVYENERGTYIFNSKAAAVL